MKNLRVMLPMGTVHLAILFLLVTISFAQPLAQLHPVKVLTNISYIQKADYPEDKDKLDLYLPSDLKVFPVVVFLHGGALMRRDKDSSRHIGQFLASRGVGGVIPNYRLSPGGAHPAHIQDVAAAFAWAHTHVQAYGGNPQQMFVMGWSAGGYLAALLGCDPTYLQQYGLSLKHIRGVVPISRFFHVNRVAVSRSKTIWGTDEEAWLKASPTQYVSRSVPSILFLYAEGDTPERQQESEDMATLLRHKGHPHTTAKEISKRDHLSIWSRFGREYEELGGDTTSTEVLRFVHSIVENN